jgi:hypothetical protein
MVRLCFTMRTRLCTLPSVRKTASLGGGPYVCPEPVLVNRWILYINGAKMPFFAGFCRRYRNIFLITSPDGQHWDDTDWLEPVALRDNEGCFNVVWDPVEEHYRGFALSRGGPEEIKIRGSSTDTTSWAKRLIFTCTAPQLAGPWTDLVPCLRATAEDDELAQQRPSEGLVIRSGSGVPNAGAVKKRAF